MSDIDYELGFKLKHINFEGKDYLALEYAGQEPVHFIFIEKGRKKYWFCLTTMTEVKQAAFTKLLNSAFMKIMEAINNV